MTMHHVLAILLVFRLGVLDAGMALANGWAHGSIPFAALLVGLTVEDSTTRARSAQYLGLRGSVLAVRPLIDLLGGGEENPPRYGPRLTPLWAGSTTRPASLCSRAA